MECSQTKKPVHISNTDTPNKNNSRSSSSLHQSVLTICKKFPSLRIPATCLDQHLDPCVVMTKLNPNLYMPKKSTKLQVAVKKTFSAEQINSLIVHNSKRKNEINSASSSTSFLINNEPKLKKLKIVRDRIVNVDVAEHVSRDDDTNTLLLHSSKPSTQTHICQICNKVLYSEKELLRHNKQHMRCPYCKKKFSSLQKKNYHYEYECHIKIMMNNLPTIPLQRIDQNLDARLKYSDAFMILSSPNMSQSTNVADKSTNVADKIKKSNVTRRISDSSSDDCNNENDQLKEADPLEITTVNEIVDENELVQTTNSAEPDALEIGIEVTMPEEDDPLSIDVPNNINTQLQEKDPLEIPTPPQLKINNVVGTAGVNESHLKKNSGVPDIVLKPVIKVNGEQLKSNAKSSEIKLVKSLLKKCKSGIMKKTTSTQTDTPSTNNVMNLSENTCELKHFRQFLTFYKIPVNILCGTFKVHIKYNNDFNQQLRCKEMHLWENETIIGTKPRVPVITVNTEKPVHTATIENHSASQQLVTLANMADKNQMIQNVTKNNIISKPSVPSKALISKPSQALVSTTNQYNIPNISTISNNLNMNPGINTSNLFYSNNKTTQNQNKLINSQITVSYESFKSLINVQANVPITRVNIEPNSSINTVTVQPNIPIQNVNIQTFSIATQSATYNGTSALNQSLIRQNPSQSSQQLLLKQSSNCIPSTISQNMLPIMNNLFVNSGSTPSVLNTYFNNSSRNLNDSNSEAKQTSQYVRVKSISDLK